MFLSLFDWQDKALFCNLKIKKTVKVDTVLVTRQEKPRCHCPGQVSFDCGHVKIEVGAPVGKWNNSLSGPVVCLKVSNFQTETTVKFRIGPGPYIFQRPFLRGLFFEGLIFWGAYILRGLGMEGNLCFKIDWASL